MIPAIASCHHPPRGQGPYDSVVQHGQEGGVVGIQGASVRFDMSTSDSFLSQIRGKGDERSEVQWAVSRMYY